MSKRRQAVTAPTQSAAVPADLNEQLATLLAPIAVDAAPAPVAAPTPTPAPAPVDIKPATVNPDNALVALENGLIAEVSHTAKVQAEQELHDATQGETFAPVYKFIREHRELTPMMVTCFVDQLAIASDDAPETVTLTKKSRRNIKQAFDAALKAQKMGLSWLYVDANGKPNRQGQLVGAEIVERTGSATVVPFDEIAKAAAAKNVKVTPKVPSSEAVTVVEQAIRDTTEMVANNEIEAETQDSFEATLFDAGVTALASGLDPAAVLATLSIVANRLKVAIQDNNSRRAMAERLAKAAEKEATKAAADLAKAEQQAMADNPELFVPEF